MGAIQQVLMGYGPTGGGGDPYTKSLLHFDGTDGSTTVTDETGKTWTAFNNFEISTDEFKFGSSSGLWDGSSDYIETPYTADFNWGTNDLTIECFVRVSLGADRGFISQRNSGASGWALEVRSTGAVWLRGFIGSYSDTKITTATSAVTADVWTHIAFVRFGDDWTIYVDGVGMGFLNDANSLDNGGNAPIRMGRSQSGSEDDYSGYIDEMRISNGIARYTADFTPPAAPFTYP